jgi:lysophospholipase L1-like esterase
MIVSRRQFLTRLVALPSVVFAARGLFALPTDTPFEFLVVGDSLVWGQGLEEKDKFYTLTKNWLEFEAFGRRIPVNLKIKAHSGSTLTLDENEAEAFRKAGLDESKFYEPEINVGFPTIERQIEIARNEYESPESVRLIMVSGGITDLSVAGVLNPFGNNKQLVADIDKYCGESLSRVLAHAADAFPNALIAVIGYYPMISPRTRTYDIFNFALEAYGVPRPLKPLANNVATRPFLRIIGNKAIKRSRIWAERSEKRLRESVERLNAEKRTTRAVFIKAPIDESNTYGTPDTLVFKMLKKGRIEDSMYDERRELCDPVLTGLKDSTGLKYPIRFCETAAIGHPNPAGARAFAESIKSAIKPLLVQ